MFSINLFLFYYVTTVNIPFSDDFWFLDIVNKYFQADTVLNKISILRSQFNLGENPITHSIGYLEHRHTLIKILLVLQVKSIGQINIRHFMLLNCFVLIFTFYYFFISIKSHFTNQPLLLAACCAIYFSLVFYMNIFWFMSTPNNLLLMFGFGALYYLKNNRFYFAIIFMALSLLSSYGGILFFCLSCLYLFIIKDYIKMFVLIFITIVSILIYSFGLIKNHDANLIKVIFNAPWYLLLLFFSCVGSVGLAVIPSIILGCIYLLYFLYLIKRKTYINEPYLFTILVLMFAICLGIVIQRYDHGFSYVMTTRFKIFSVFITMIYLLIFQKLNNAFFQKYKYIFLVTCLMYFGIGNVLAYHKALQRKSTLITGVDKYKHTGTGLYINNDTYKRDINKIKVDEVNAIMYDLQKNNFYVLSN